MSEARRWDMTGFLLGATGMFATMYATQAILPALSAEFGVSPARAGLTISVVVLALAVAAWLWGPLSDRIGRRRSIVLASGLLVAPTLAAAFAPTFPTLVACRALQGACMPGLLTVGVPYVMEVYGRRHGGKAMGAYVASLVVGGVVGRVGVGLVAAATTWRYALGGLAVFPLAAAVMMARTLPAEPPIPRSRSGLAGLCAHLRNRALLQAATAAVTVFFAFVGVFSFVVYRLAGPPFQLSPAGESMIFLLWVVGVIGPPTGRLADRWGWRPLVMTALGLAAVGVAVTLAATLVVVLAGLGLIATAMFGGVTAAQLGVADAAPVDRGLASALYFSAYYTSGALGAYVPGVVWQVWRWNGVVILALAVLGAGILIQIMAGRGRGRAAHTG